MTVYTVHAPPASSSIGGADTAERFVFIKDGFSWGAFLIPFIWMLYRRLWIVFAIYLLVSVAIAFLANAGLAPLSMALGVLTPFVLGFEGNAMRAWTLDRRGYTMVGTAEGSALEDAELRFFARWVDGRPVQAAATAPRPVVRSFRETPTGVIGLFPTAGNPS